MAQDDFVWIYLVIFLVIPLARIIPRFLQKWKQKKNTMPKPLPQQSFPSSTDTKTHFHEEGYSGDNPKEMNSQSLEMLVLGELNRGVKNFNNIQKNLGIETEKLDETLEGLEKQGLMKVHEKQGLFGKKIELIPTDEGFKKFYS